MTMTGRELIDNILRQRRLAVVEGIPRSKGLHAEALRRTVGAELRKIYPS
jgi:hypothetical protein